MSTVTLSNNWSYDRMMRLFGGMWFMLLALCVAIKIGSLTDPWPSLLSSFCLASFYMLLALLTMTRSPAKAQADGLLPRIAAFVGTYLPWTITFFGQTAIVWCAPMTISNSPVAPACPRLGPCSRPSRTLRTASRWPAAILDPSSARPPTQELRPGWRNGSQPNRETPAQPRDRMLLPTPDSEEAQKSRCTASIAKCV
jgi:hypothetical protein